MPYVDVRRATIELDMWQLVEGGSLPTERANGDPLVDNVDICDHVVGSTLTHYRRVKSTWVAAYSVEVPAGVAVDAGLARTISRTYEAAAVATVADTTVDVDVAASVARTIARTVAAAATGEVVAPDAITATVDLTSDRTVVRTVAVDAAGTVAANVDVTVDAAVARTVARTVAAEATAEAGATFSPDDVSGLAVWLEADTIAGLSADDPVSTWTDAVNSEAFTASGSDRPLYVEDAFNGHAGVNFDSVDARLDGTISRLFKPATIFALIVPRDHTTSSIHTLLGGTADGDFLLRTTDTTNQMDIIREGDYEIANAGVRPMNAPTLVEVSYGSAGAYLFGLQGKDVASGTNSRTLASQVVRLGMASDEGEPFSGDVIALLVYDSVLSAPDRADVRQWFLDTYSVGQWTPDTPTTLTFDTVAYDGIFNFLGTFNGDRDFGAPGSIGSAGAYGYTAAQSSEVDVTRTAEKATTHGTDAVVDCAHTVNVASSWWRADFGADYRVEVDHYAIQGRSSDGQHLRSWKLQGSQDASTWTDIDTQTSNTSIGDNTWFNGSVSNSTAWRYIRILQTGSNSSGQNILTLGEVELWGTYQEA